MLHHFPLETAVVPGARQSPTGGGAGRVVDNRIIIFLSSTNQETLLKRRTFSEGMFSKWKSFSQKVVQNLIGLIYQKRDREHFKYKQYSHITMLMAFLFFGACSNKHSSTRDDFKTIPGPPG
jgi:hypothetical protein